MDALNALCLKATLLLSFLGSDSWHYREAAHGALTGGPRQVYAAWALDSQDAEVRGRCRLLAGDDALKTEWLRRLKWVGVWPAIDYGYLFTWSGVPLTRDLTSTNDVNFRHACVFLVAPDAPKLWDTDHWELTISEPQFRKATEMYLRHYCYAWSDDRVRALLERWTKYEEKP